MKSILRRGCDEQGIALVMALGVLLALTIALAATLELAGAGGRSTNSVNADQKAYTLAEAGINNAMAIVAQTLADTTAIKPEPAYAGDPNSTIQTLDGGTVTWGGTFDVSKKTWTFKAIGSVRNPNDPSSPAVTRTVRGAVKLEPPPFSFISYNPAAEHHTLVVRLGGQMTVASDLYVSSNHLDDGFDLFGAGGNLSAPNILVHGGWETHDNDTVVASTSWTWKAATRVVTHTVGAPHHAAVAGDSVTMSKFTGAQSCFNGTFAVLASPAPTSNTFSYAIPVGVTCNPGASGGLAAGGLLCPYPSALLGRKVATSTAPVRGCPLTGQPQLADPLADVPVPALGSGVRRVVSTPVDVIRKARKANVVTLTTSVPHGINPGTSITVFGVDADLDGVKTVLATPTTTTLTYASTGPDLPTITAKQLTSGVATLTSSTGHTLSVGDLVTVTGVDSVFNAALAPVTAVPSPTTFSYAKARPAFTRSVSKKELDTPVALLTMTADATHPIVTGDIINVSGVDSWLNGGPFTVTSAPSATTLTYNTSPAFMILTVTKKQMTAGVATLTTSANHGLDVGDSVVVNIGSPTFNGTYTVTAVPSATTFKYSPDPFGYHVTNTTIASGVATLTTLETPTFPVNSSITINIGDPRFDGNVTVTAVNAAAKTFSYTPSPITNSAWAWDLSSHTVTMTSASANGLNVGDVITITGFGTSRACMNMANVAVSAVNVAARQFSYQIPSSQCTPPNPGASGTQNNTVTIITVASVGGNGTATVTAMPLTNVTVSPNSVTVPAFIAAGTAATGTVSATGNVALTPTTGAFTPAAAPSTGSVVINDPGSPALPTPYAIPTGSETLQPGTYYGGLCIGATVCVPSTSCAPPRYSPNLQLNGNVTATQTTVTASGVGVQVGDTILVGSEWMNVTARDATLKILTVTRGYSNTTAAIHEDNDTIFKVKATPDATVTMLPGVYIMAGGGFHVCGSAKLIANGVMIYNTKDALATSDEAKLNQIVLNTTGSVSLIPATTGVYAGLVIFQDRALDVDTDRYGTDVNCDGKSKDADVVESPNDSKGWDIALLSMASTGTDGALGSISGSIYAPDPHALFADSVSGKSNLAIMTGCIYIDGGDSTFKYDSTGLWGNKVTFLGIWG